MKDEKITFSCPPEVAERLARLTKKTGLTRSRLILNIVDEMTKTLEFTEKVGVLDFALMMRNLGDDMSKWAKKVKAKRVDPL
jgi:predicted DNA-binding protein